MPKRGLVRPSHARCVHAYTYREARFYQGNRFFAAKFLCRGYQRRYAPHGLRLPRRVRRATSGLDAWVLALHHKSISPFQQPPLPLGLSPTGRKQDAAKFTAPEFYLKRWPYFLIRATASTTCCACISFGGGLQPGAGRGGQEVENPK